MSILLAFAIDAGWDERSARRQEGVMLLALREELVANEDLLSEAMADCDRQSADLRTIIEWSPSDLRALGETEAVEFMEGIGGDCAFEPQVAQLESMLASGQLALVGDSELRRQISEWRNALPQLQDQWEAVRGQQDALLNVTADHSLFTAAVSVYAPFEAGTPFAPSGLSVANALAASRSDSRFSERAVLLWVTRASYTQKLGRVRVVSRTLLGKL